MTDDSARPAPSATTDGYEDLEPLLIALRMLDDDDPQRTVLRDRVIERALPLAGNIARRFGGRGEPLDDLVQVARIGLVNAVERFDPANGASFLAFAIPTIMGHVRRHFRDNTWTMHVPRGLKEISARLGPAIETLLDKLGRSPTPSEIAAELDLDLDDVTQALIARNAYQPTSLDAEFTRQDDITTLRTLGQPAPGFERVDARLTVGPLISALPEEDRRVLAMRFFESKTQTEIAHELGVSQMQVSRILSRILTQLREQARPE